MYHLYSFTFRLNHSTERFEIIANISIPIPIKHKAIDNMNRFATHSDIVSITIYISFLKTMLFVLKCQLKFHLTPILKLF